MNTKRKNIVIFINYLRARNLISKKKKYKINNKSSKNQIVGNDRK